MDGHTYKACWSATYIKGCSLKMTNIRLMFISLLRNTLTIKTILLRHFCEVKYLGAVLLAPSSKPPEGQAYRKWVLVYCDRIMQTSD